jgi:hypothetical protein
VSPLVCPNPRCAELVPFGDHCGECGRRLFPNVRERLEVLLPTDVEQAQRLFDSTYRGLTDEQRLAHVKAVLRMIENPAEVVTL